MIGSIILTFALACSIFSALMYYLNFRGYKNTLNYGRIGYHSMVLLVLTAAFYLEYLILTHNYGYKYVYDYSSNNLAKGILAATFWAGQEGSFMLWLVLSSIVGLVLQNYSSKRGDLEPRVMAVFSLATTFLLIMVSPLFKNPFAFIWSEPIFLSLKDINPSLLSLPFLQNFQFTDAQSGQSFIKMNSELFATLSSGGISLKEFIINGKGLNPQLLNFWMQIHPPILFTGFSMATVPFSFAMAALMKNDYREWVKQSFPWVLAGAGILGLGIMMGGYWAYEMLGWGGYWAWDPVENSSLIPWLVGVASIHTLLVQRKSQAKGGIGKFAKTNIILCLLTYVLVLYSTFLTRSGVLGDASVHSFVDPGMLVYLFLIIFIGSFLVLGFGMVIYRWKHLSEKIASEEQVLSRDLALFTAAIVLSASALIVLVGTSAPIFGKAVDAFFYSELHVPLAIIIGLLNGLSLLLKWNMTRGKDLLKSSIIPISIALLVTLMIIILGGVKDVMMIILSFSCAFTLAVNIDIAFRIIRGSLNMIGAYIAHIGIALFLLGVIGSAGYSKQIDVNLEKNVPVSALGYEMVFTGYNPIENTNKYQFNISLKKDDKSFSVAPIMYISDFNNGLMREPAIMSMFTHDIYVSPLGYEEDDGSSNKGNAVSFQKGDSKVYEGVKITFDDFNFPPETRQAMMQGKDFEIGVNLTAESHGKKIPLKVAWVNKSGQKTLTSADLKEDNVKITLLNLDASGKVDLALSKLDGSNLSAVKKPKEVLTVTASIKPFINFVWTGVLIMVFGFVISVIRRLKESFK
ncbi:MAG: cytochrome c-type biogenesis CcmF C-terminal domain-containing protein [Ignavibacteriaceae bacterium]|nr:cytochrome c-type biogenesis CcmF C-terminal domain-containing protein [Ignavibacteriaceae bacterium]